jgi:hypothetical protein
MSTAVVKNSTRVRFGREIGAGATRTGPPGLLGSFTTTERDTTMHAASELREWFLEWLDGDNGKFDDEAVAKLKELRSCTDELSALPANQFGRFQLCG